MAMEIESLRQQCAAQLAELEAISAALGTSEGHSSVAHILDLRQQIVMLRGSLLASANYIDALGGNSFDPRRTLAATEQPK